jgi:hypothetical protein
MARPPKPINQDQLKKLAAIGLSNAEVAAVLDCSPDTIERRYHNLLEWGREHRNASLRRKQFEVAMSGHPTMLIWLGKQFLGQADKQEVTGQNGGPIQVRTLSDFYADAAKK